MTIIKKTGLVLLFLIFISLILLGSLFSSGCSKKELGWRVGKLLGGRDGMMPEMNEEMKQKMIDACYGKNENDECVIEMSKGIKRDSFEGKNMEQNNLERKAKCKINEEEVLICMLERNFMGR